MGGRVVLVTGGTRGIGRAIARAMAAAGARVAICGRGQDQLDAVAGELAGSEILARRCDVADPDEVRGLIAAVDARFGGLHLLVNNAGLGGEQRPVEESDPEVWRRIVEVNLCGTYLVTHAALPLLRRSAPSQIINVGSGLGHGPRPGNTAYSVAKAGVRMFTRCLAQEVWGLGIDVNELVPGPVATEMTRDTMPAGGPPPFAESERVKTPEEVADSVLWMATRPAGGPTGQTFSLARRPL